MAKKALDIRAETSGGFELDVFVDQYALKSTAVDTALRLRK